MLLFCSYLINPLQAQAIDWDAVKDRYVEKHQPEELPDWLFPLIFKDSTGASDCNTLIIETLELHDYFFLLLSRLKICWLCFGNN